jgi:hypothetical protein
VKHRFSKMNTNTSVFVFMFENMSLRVRPTLTRGCFNNWPFTHNKLLRRQAHKTLGYPLIHYLWSSITTTRPSCHSKCTHLNQVNVRLGHWIGNPWDFSVILSVVPTTIGSLFHFGRFGFVLLLLCQFRY